MGEAETSTANEIPMIGSVLNLNEAERSWEASGRFLGAVWGRRSSLVFEWLVIKAQLPSGVW